MDAIKLANKEIINIQSKIYMLYQMDKELNSLMVNCI